MRKKQGMFLVLFLLLGVLGFAIKTQQLEIGKSGVYDGKVTIFRDEGGNLLFKDDAHSSPVLLSSLSQGVSDHNELAGLGGDDHAQYLNTTRHNTEHSYSFNDELSLSPDVANHTTLGGHVQDSAIHVNRNLNETIGASWKFEGEPEFRDNIRFSLHGEQGKMDLIFEDGEEDAMIRWDDGYEHFEFNRKIKGEEAEIDNVTIATGLRVPGTIYGNPSKSVATGKIENFVSIEGINSSDLVDKSTDEDISGKWDFLNDVYIDGDLVTSGVLNPMGGIKGLGKGNLVTVAKKGGDFDKIQDAIDSITDNSSDNPYVVFVYPGVYEEEVTIDKSYISIVGIDREKCIVRKDNVITGSIGYGSGVVNLKKPNCGMVNLTIKNIGQDDGTNTTPAVIFSSGSGYVDNCYIGGNGGRDIFCILNTAEVTCRNTTVEQYRATSSASHPIWVCNSASLIFNNSKQSILGSGGGCQLNTTGNCSFRYSTLEGNGYAIDSSLCGDLEIVYCETSSSNFFSNENYSNLITNFSDGLNTNVSGDITIGGGATIGEDTTINGDFTINGADLIGTNYRKRYVEDNGKTEWSTDTGTPSWDVNLYRGGTDELKTDVAFNCNFLESAETRWKDYAALAYVGWHDSGWSRSNDCLTDTTGDQLCYFPIMYEPGTTIAKVRVKWDGTTEIDGVKLRIVKRQDSGTSTGWTPIGTHQEYYGDSVTVSEYDCTDFSIDAGYSYCIEIESVVDAAGAFLYSVGVKTGPRVM